MSCRVYEYKEFQRQRGCNLHHRPKRQITKILSRQRVYRSKEFGLFPASCKVMGDKLLLTTASLTRTNFILLM